MMEELIQLGTAEGTSTGPVIHETPMDRYGIDSHKLMYHVERVNEWTKGKIVYPIYAEMSPSGACNHRCTFCGVDYMGYRVKFLEAGLLKKRLTEMGELGLKSVMYAGEGEPLLHKDIAEILIHTENSGIDAALTTNAVLLNEKLVDNALESITWIKASISGGTRETYAKIHRTRPEDFDMVMKNLEYAIKVKEEKGCKITLGVQMLLLPENWHEAETLAQKAKDMGLDYLVVKPYSQHLKSKTQLYKNIRYEEYMHLADKLANYNDKNFNVVFRINTMKKWDDKERPYEHCLALPFWTYVDADGIVWGCSCYMTDKRFYYGNIYQNTFAEIWNSDLRKKSLRFCENELDTSTCRINCRMDEINRYLWELRHNPPEHVNFI